MTKINFLVIIYNVLNFGFKILEKIIEKQTSDYAKDKGCLSYKLQSPSYRSLPDRLIITPKGDVLFIEFKQANKKPTKLQQHTIDKLKAHNCQVYVIDCPKKGIELINAKI